MDLSKGLTGLGISDYERESLQKSGIQTIEALLNHLPKRYEDRRAFTSYSSLAIGESVCLIGAITDFRNRFSGGAKPYCEAVFQIRGQELSLDGKLALRWYNMPYIQRVLAVGVVTVLYGKLKETNNGLAIDHPEFEIIEGEDVDSIHMNAIVPVYRKVQGITQRRMRDCIAMALAEPSLLERTRFFYPSNASSRLESFRSVHFPSEMGSIKDAKRPFALEEFFLLQLGVLREKQSVESLVGFQQGHKTELLKAFYQSLPFDLTNAQKRCIKEVLADMRTPAPMQRLLQGDVGSGKTFVAVCAMVLAVDSGHQAALMAPTQILAEQHYYTFQKWLSPLGIRLALVTGARLEQDDTDGKEAQIIIGTHALLYDKLQFQDLSLVVIDEQHRFGVEQRRRLIEQAERPPDVLAMTATPIPRTLTLSLYGDLDVSILDELPAGREKIVSGVRQTPKVSEVTAFLKEHLKEGRQVYIVYSLVEESETLKADAVTVEYEKWKKRFSKYEVAIIHGKLKPSEKDDIMNKFRDGAIQVLIATSVIEVGVDVPNANIMLIYDAERFGLAQLHQLRGRVGRGTHKSYCVLITKSKEEQALQKLKILAQTGDGFQLAEEDLKIRGPGEIFGTAQSGIGELSFPEYLSDLSLIQSARTLAQNCLKNSSPQNVAKILEYHPSSQRS